MKRCLVDLKRGCGKLEKIMLQDGKQGSVKIRC